ncbi:MAG: hypothetical protein IJZ59_04790 [Alphaproteobacteria bacterium]|nr:hypothetical protein [Alphaproteobacteria bacterium]
MMAEEINLTVQHLLIDDEIPSKNEFKSIEKTFPYIKQHPNNPTYYTINTELTKKYFWLYARYGSPNPRPDNVLNIANFENEKNPRTENMVEQKQQLFVLYDLEDNLLYLSNIKQKGFIADLLKEKIEKEVSIKDIYKDIDEFYKIISSVEKISFTSVKRDLFSKFNNLNQVLADNYGMEEPEEFSIEAKYHRPLSQKIKNAINGLRNDEGIDKVIIRGLDDQGFDKIFNSGTFVQKISFTLDKNENGLWSDIEVKAKILEKLGLKDD